MHVEVTPVAFEELSSAQKFEKSIAAKLFAGMLQNQVSHPDDELGDDIERGRRCAKIAIDLIVGLTEMEGKRVKDELNKL